MFEDQLKSVPEVIDGVVFYWSIEGCATHADRNHQFFVNYRCGFASFVSAKTFYEWKTKVHVEKHVGATLKRDVSTTDWVVRENPLPHTTGSVRLSVELTWFTDDEFDAKAKSRVNVCAQVLKHVEEDVVRVTVVDKSYHVVRDMSKKASRDNREVYFNWFLLTVDSIRFPTFAEMSSYYKRSVLPSLMSEPDLECDGEPLYDHNVKYDGDFFCSNLHPMPSTLRAFEASLMYSSQRANHRDQLAVANEQWDDSWDDTCDMPRPNGDGENDEPEQMSVEHREVMAALRSKGDRSPLVQMGRGYKGLRTEGGRTCLIGGEHCCSGFQVYVRPNRDIWYHCFESSSHASKAGVRIGKASELSTWGEAKYPPGEAKTEGYREYTGAIASTGTWKREAKTFTHNQTNMSDSTDAERKDNDVRDIVPLQGTRVYCVRAGSW